MAAFLQNNGDILLDAVLTDYGRRLLARGDGSFNIVKFAFADDEIDYGLFSPDTDTINQDIAIMNTPILEAFTNNAASMKNQLLTLSMQNLLYLPILKLNTGLQPQFMSSYFNGFVIPVNTTSNKTTTSLYTSTTTTGESYYETYGINSLTPVLKSGVITTKHSIFIDQGLDSSNLDQTKNLKYTDPALYENSYNVYIDTRFGYITDNNGNALMPLSVDDDGVGVYKFTEQTTATNATHVTEIVYDANNANNQIILGTQGSRFKFGVVPNNNLTSDTYFNRYGDSGIDLVGTSDTYKTLRSTVKVTGVSTGYSIEIPILYTKVE